MAVGVFLSTLSLRRATTIRTPLFSTSTYFYPRSPCGERLCAEHHANSQQEFLSTLSLRRATPYEGTHHQLAPISIHALLAESDSKYARSFVIDWAFLSTLSLRRATGILGGRLRYREQFLSTLSLRRATISARREARESIDFYPRSPCGERQARCARHHARDDFYPRSPCGERPSRVNSHRKIV